MTNTQHLLINSVHPEEFRVALVNGQLLNGFFIETSSRGKFVGNIYKGTIVHIQPSLQAAFVEYGVERNGFLSFSEIHPEYYQVDEDLVRHNHLRIQDAIHPGQEVLVQVVKEEIGNKGAVLTTYISLAGRYVVLMPGQNQRGVSRKIDNEAEREKLKELARDLKVPEDFGIIIRTVAEDRPKREIQKDLNYLLRVWEDIKSRVQETPAPALIYKERDLAIRVVRDYFNPNIKSILIDDKDIYRSVKEFLRIVSPKHERTVKLYKDDGPIFAKYNIEGQIEQIFQKKIYLKSGGYLVIEPTEALVTIDVNSGRAKKEDELEEMVYRVNMEAATEIPRQLRLRDLGGLIVIDFIDMRDRRHIRDVEKRLRDEIKEDKAKVTIGRISRFGLLELSRQHIGLNIQLGSYKDCPHCQGAGLVRSADATALCYLRKIWLTLVQKDIASVKGIFSPEVANYLLNQKRNDLINLEEKYGVTIHIEGVPGILPHEGKLEWVPKEAKDVKEPKDMGKDSKDSKDRKERKDHKEPKESSGVEDVVETLDLEEAENAKELPAEPEESGESVEQPRAPKERREFKGARSSRGRRGHRGARDSRKAREQKDAWEQKDSEEQREQHSEDREHLERVGNGEPRQAEEHGWFEEEKNPAAVAEDEQERLEVAESGELLVESDKDRVHREVGQQVEQGGLIWSEAAVEPEEHPELPGEPVDDRAEPETRAPWEGQGDSERVEEPAEAREEPEEPRIQADSHVEPLMEPVDHLEPHPETVEIVEPSESTQDPDTEHPEESEEQQETAVSPAESVELAAQQIVRELERPEPEEPATRNESTDLAEQPGEKIEEQPHGHAELEESKEASEEESPESRSKKEIVQDQPRYLIPF